MSEVERALRERIGLDAASIGSSLIQRSVRLRMKSHGLKRLDEYHRLLHRSGDEWDQLVETVVVTETWFFRDQQPFTALARLMVDEWLPSHPIGRARLLSLPCSSGEEPYSLVMSLLDAGVPPERFEIDGLDISSRALASASRGIYGKNSFRGRDLSYRERYFLPTREGFVLSPRVRQCVRFQRENVLNDEVRVAYGPYDFIFCRNLLIYFDRPTQEKCLSSISSLLAPDGTLFVGAAELPLALEHGFHSVHLPQAFGCRKTAPGVKYGAEHSAKAVPGFKETIRDSSPARVSQRASRTRPRSEPAKETALETARRLADAGRLQEAEQICKECLEQKGASALAYYLLGLVRDASGDPAAEDFYRKALYLDPNHYESLLQLGLWLERHGDLARARRFKYRAQRLKP